MPSSIRDTTVRKSTRKPPDQRISRKHSSSACSSADDRRASMPALTASGSAAMASADSVTPSRIASLSAGRRASFRGRKCPADRLGSRASNTLPKERPRSRRAEVRDRAVAGLHIHLVELCGHRRGHTTNKLVLLLWSFAVWLLWSCDNPAGSSGKFSWRRGL